MYLQNLPRLLVRCSLVPILCLTAALLCAPASAQVWPELGEDLPSLGGGEQDAAVIIAISDYASVEDIPGADQNARDWYAWMTRSRGVPAERVRLLQDNYGTLEKMRRGLEEAAANVQPGGTLWVIFIGHGSPSEDGRDGVLVGFDAQQDPESLYARSLRQSELLQLAGKGAQARTVVLVDACFSGKSGSGEALAKGLQPLIAVKENAAVIDRTVVLSAGTSAQFAGPLPGADRPAFSYLALGALRGWGDRDKDGQVTADEVQTYTLDALRTLLVGRAQTPEVRGSSGAPLVAAAGEQGPSLSDIALHLSRQSGDGGGSPVSANRGPRRPAFFSGAHSLHLMAILGLGYGTPDKFVYSSESNTNIPTEAVFRSNLGLTLLGVHGWIEWGLTGGYTFASDPNSQALSEGNTKNFTGFFGRANLGFPLFSWPSPDIFPDSWLTLSTGVAAEVLDGLDGGVYVANTAYFDCLWMGRAEVLYQLSNGDYQPPWSAIFSVGVQTGRDEVCK